MMYNMSCYVIGFQMNNERWGGGGGGGGAEPLSSLIPQKCVINSIVTVVSERVLFILHCLSELKYFTFA